MRIDNKKRRGPNGPANVKVLKDKVIVEFENQAKYPEPYVFAKEAAPDYLMSGRFRVSLSLDESEINSVGIAEKGQYLVKVARFVKGKDTPPSPKFRDRKWVDNKKTGGGWWVPAHEEFYVLLEVVAGTYEGFEIFAGFDYCFNKDQMTGLAFIDGSLATGSKKVDQLVDFLVATGAADVEIPFSENVLPELEEAIAESDATFQVVLTETGWIDSISELPEGFVVKKAKKPAKKAPAKSKSKK